MVVMKEPKMAGKPKATIREKYVVLQAAEAETPDRAAGRHELRRRNKAAR